MGDVVAKCIGDGGGDKCGDGGGNDNAGQDDGPDEIVVDRGTSVVVVSPEAFGGDGLESRGEAGERSEEICRGLFGPALCAGAFERAGWLRECRGYVDAYLGSVLEEPLGVAECVVEV